MNGLPEEPASTKSTLAASQRANLELEKSAELLKKQVKALQKAIEKKTEVVGVPKREASATKQQLKVTKDELEKVQLQLTIRPEKQGKLENE
jgi:hypothetical protein